MKQEISDLERAAIVEIVDKYYASEEKDYCDTFPDEDHIYYAFKCLQRWLERTAV